MTATTDSASNKCLARIVTLPLGAIDESRNKEIHRDEAGLEVVEYAIILGLIVAATLTLMVALGNWVVAQFNAAATSTTT